MSGVDQIIHAGDIGGAAILDALRAIAPVHAVRGNNDHGVWVQGIPETLDLELESVALHVLHDLKELKQRPAPFDTGVVIAGHSHRPLLERRGGVLYFNPGSAGPRRFNLPITVGVLALDGGGAEGKIVTLEGLPLPPGPA